MPTERKSQSSGEKLVSRKDRQRHSETENLPSIERIFTVRNKKFGEELIAYFPLIRHEHHRKRHLQHFSVVAGTSLQSLETRTASRETYVSVAREACRQSREAADGLKSR
jgi:hypothetical protein